MSSRLDTARRALILMALLYGFFVGLDLMGLSFKLMGSGLAETLLATTSNPFIGLFIGLLATSLVQSSSTTTSITVGLVAAGALTVEGAVPIIMGANIGTTVTNTIVALGHMGRSKEFERAFAGATVHDFFNWMAVAVMFPLEITTGFLSRSALALEAMFEGAGGVQLANPLKAVVRPTAEALSDLTGPSGTLTLVLGIVLIVAALKLLVDVLRAGLGTTTDRLIQRTLFRTSAAAIAVGALVTVAVQSSSITTSILVPLVGAGVITLEQMFPFTLGANIGTTITAILAALATGEPAAIAVAMAHLLFNLIATLVIYGIPRLRAIPLYLARNLGQLAARSKSLAIAYVALLFFGLPLLLLALSGGLPTGPSDEDPVEAVAEAPTVIPDAPTPVESNQVPDEFFP
jgi:sodium-dependent phosphate cotransporter